MLHLHRSLPLTLMVLALLACSAPPTLTPEPPPTPTAAATPTLAVVVLPALTATLPMETLVPAAAAPTAPAGTPTLQPPTAVPPTATRPPATATVAPSPSPAPPERVDPVVTSLVVTPGEPPLLYAVVDARLFKSADRGATWSEESSAGLPAGGRFNGVAIDYRHPETMYGLTSEGIYRREGSANWSLVNTLRATALAVDLENPDVLWAGIYRTSEMDAVIVKSEDRGRTWGKADWGIPYSGWTTDILVNPTNPNVLWAVVRSGGGHDWPPGDLYRGGRDGHWERMDLGQFNPAFGNPDSCFTAGIAYDPNANLLFCGCDLSYFIGGNLFFLRSANADAADSSTVRWEVATHFPAEAAQRMGMARPLAVDAREPKSLYLSVAIQEWGQPTRYRILVSHNYGTTWDALEMRGLPQPAGD